MRVGGLESWRVGELEGKIEKPDSFESGFVVVMIANYGFLSRTSSTIPYSLASVEVIQ